MIALRRGSIVLLALGLAGICGREALWPAAGLSLVLGAVWLGGRELGWSGSASIGLSGYTALIAYGAIVGVPTGSLLLGITSAIIAWDLDRLAVDVGESGRVIDQKLLVWSHLVRLAMPTGLSLLLGSIALSLTIRLSFLWVVVIVTLAMLLLRRLLQKTPRDV